jgi:hypothetical protein
MSPADSQPPPPLPELDSYSNSNTNSDAQTYIDHLKNFALCIFRHTTNTYRYLVYPNRMHQWRNLNEIKDHVLGMARSKALREDNMKTWSRHCVLVRNEGWIVDAP